jgi:hypothetical protein
MVGRIAPLSSPPVLPFPSFPPANLFRACASGSRASALSFPHFRHCTETRKCPSVSPLLATLTHSCSRKSFPCHFYENTRNGGASTPPGHPLLRRRLRRITPLSPVPSVDCAYFPSPRRCAPSSYKNFSVRSVPLWQSILCFHTPLPRSARGTNSFSRNPFVFTLICVARGCHPNSSAPARPSGGSPWQIHSFQAFAASLSTFSTSRPLFSATCSLFSEKQGGGGGYGSRGMAKFQPSETMASRRSEDFIQVNSDNSDR